MRVLGRGCMKTSRLAWSGPSATADQDVGAGGGLGFSIGASCGGLLTHAGRAIFCLWQSTRPHSTHSKRWRDSSEILMHEARRRIEKLENHQLHFHAETRSSDGCKINVERAGIRPTLKEYAKRLPQELQLDREQWCSSFRQAEYIPQSDRRASSLGIVAEHRGRGVSWSWICTALRRRHYCCTCCSIRLAYCTGS